VEAAMTGSVWKNYGFAWVTAGFFLLSLSEHFVAGWFAYTAEQQAHHEAPALGGYLIVFARDTLENWQSEFLQLIWQVSGLAMLLHVGSPQSKEGHDRMEAKLDAILRRLEPDRAEQIIDDIDRAYAGRHTDPLWLRQEERGEAP
jgi:hypothetical protein